MDTFEQDYEIDAPIGKVWQALTDAGLMSEWSGESVQSVPKEGGAFSLWGGDIHGVYTKLIPDRLIEQDWYGHDNPNWKYQVSFSLTSDETVTKVHMVFGGKIVDKQKDIDDWQEYYFNPIKKILEQ